MLDKNIKKYITINEKQIIVGQTSNGIWYCKELPCKDTEEVDTNIGKLNTILNKYNAVKKIKKAPTPEKNKKNVRGLD